MLRAFEYGADDVLGEAAGYLELRARVNALLRRAGGSLEPAKRLQVGPLEIDVPGHSVRLRGRAVCLRPLEFALLVHLAREPARVFARGELLRSVWGFRAGGSTRTVDSHASRLRGKLGAGWVVGVRGVGYRLL
jgi:DNA-binding response OmpR family regulator